MKRPVLISYDYDMGWIVESWQKDNKEYEVQNLPYGWKNTRPDFALAQRIAKETGTTVKYYNKPNKGTYEKANELLK